MIKAVVFDIGGTLHTQVGTPESRRAYGEECLALLNGRGLLLGEDADQLVANVDRDIEAYKDYAMSRLIELPPETIWKDYALNAYEFDRERLDGICEELAYLYDRSRKEIRQRPHLHEMCEALCARGYRLGVISNILSRTFVPRILEEHGVAQYFEHLVLSTECGLRKPTPKIFDLCCEQMGLTKDECCYVGDTISRDIIGARRADWRCIIQILNPDAARRDAGLESCGCTPDYKVADLGEIPGILDEIRRADEAAGK